MIQISRPLRFAYGALSGLSGSVILGITLFAGWGILGESLTTSQIAVNEFGITEKSYDLHPLFHVLVVLAVFLAGLASSVVQVVLYSLSSPTTNRRFMLSQILFSQIVLLTLFLPLYFLSTYFSQSVITGFVALLHVVLSCMLCFFIIEKPTLLRLVGFCFGLIMFTTLLIIISQQVVTVMILLALPLLYGLTQLGEGALDYWYEKMSRAYGLELLEENASLINNQTAADDDDFYDE